MDIDPKNGKFEMPPGEASERHSITTKKRRIPLLVIIVGIIILLLAVAPFIYLKLHKSTKKTDQTQALTAPIIATPTLAQDVPDSTAIKPYENGPLGLKLSYPDNWKPTNTTDQGVRIESPDFTYDTVGKGTVKGNFRIYIRKGARAADSKYIARGVAIATSSALVYVQPALGQRKDTLLTQFGLDTPDNFAFFFVAGNFNLKQGDTLGPNYGKEPETFIVSGGFASADLTDDMATNPVSIELIKTSNAYKQALQILASLQLT